MNSLTSRYQKVLNTCTSSLASSAELVERYTSEKEKHRQHSLIKKLAQEYCEIEVQFKQSQLACTSCDEHFDSEDVEASASVDDVYDKFLNENVYEAVPYKEHPIWKSVNKAIYSTQQDVLGEGTSHDSSMVVSQQFQKPIDPLSKKPIENPCKSKVCGHIFEYNTIMTYIKLRQQSKNCRCPHVGCTNSNMKLDDMVLDENLRDILNQSVTQDID